MRKNKKGFTIVELVIVIAVIAVLTAVLVPTFIHLSNKAKKAADQSLVSNLNTALAMEESESGKSPNTMHDAIVGLKNQGFYVPQLVTKSDQDLVYSIDDNKFYLSDSLPTETEEQRERLHSDYWHIQSSKEVQDWSIYAFKWTGAATGLTVGFDAGEEPSISEVEYVGEKTVVIRTNNEGTKLTINAPSATVHHFDYLDELTVTAVAGSSYHEHGIVRGKAVVSKGHVEIEQGAIVPEISVENVPAGETVKVTANEQTTINVDASSAARTSVVANSENVYIDGLDSSSISGSKAEAVKTPTLVSNEAELRAANGIFAKLGADIEVATDEAILVSGKCVLDLNGHNISFASSMGDETDLYHVAKNGDLTVKGSGKVTANSRIFYVEGSLRVEDGTFVTTIMTNAADSHSTIISSEKSSVVISGGNFYSAKCNVSSYGDLVINGGRFVAIASTQMSVKNTAYSDAYAYSLRIGNGARINGGFVYGVHGGICVNGGDVVINNVYSEASADALSLFSSVHDVVRYIGTSTTKTVSTLNIASYLSSAYYSLYAAGETGVVSTTVNGGEYVSKGSRYAACIGNSSVGDGGKRLNATVVFNGGKFVANSATSIISVDYYVGTVQLAGGNFNKDKVYIAGPKTTISLPDATNIIADGYKVVAETDGTWSIVAK